MLTKRGEGVSEALGEPSIAFFGIDLTDVTLVSEDAFQRLDWCDSGE